MASSRDPKHQNRNFSDAKRHSRGAIALKLFARSLISCWAETAAPERRQLKRTLGRIALTVIDIGAIIGGEYPHSLEPQRRINTEVPSMALLPCHEENLCGFTGHMVARLQKELASSTAHGLQPSRRVPAD